MSGSAGRSTWWTMKRLAKRLMPESAIAWLRDREAAAGLRLETGLQMRRFARGYSRRGSRERARLESRVVYFTHQIEKGLSHAHMRYGFGMPALSQMIPLLVRLRAMGHGDGPGAVQAMAMDALGEYRARHEAAGYDLGYLRRLLPADMWDELGRPGGAHGGSVAVTAASKAGNRYKTFAQLSEGRRSIREFADRPVSFDEIRPAIDAAMRTPSVCNRQPTRLCVVTDRDVIARALPIQGGYRGYAAPPALILVTADNQAFMNQNERNEGFVDGGMFAMSLLLALEAEGLAACPLNTMLPARRDAATRRLLGVPDSEFLVMYIAVGHFPDETRTCRSHRFAAGDVTRVIA